jgi:hypothetical protein
MFRISLSDGIGVAGVVLAIVLVVLDKAGKLKGGWLFALLFLAGAMTLFIALGNSWVMEAPSKWKLWRGALMFSLVAFAFSATAIWISGSEPEQQATGVQEADKPAPRPMLRGTIDQVTGLITPESGHTFLVRMSLNNDGEESAAMDFVLHVTKDGKEIFQSLPDGFTRLDLRPAVDVVLGISDNLSVKAALVRKGMPVGGFLWYVPKTSHVTDE